MIELTNHKIFRPGSKREEKLKAIFLLAQGGLGDYVCYMSAILYIAKNYNYLEPHLYCPAWFIPIAQNILSDFPEWHYHVSNTLTKAEVESSYTLAPYKEPISRVGAHALDLGFIYYLNFVPPPPEDNFYPRLNLKDIDIEKFQIKKPYAVVTPGASNEPKTLKPHGFNSILDYLLDKNITPVFLGNETFRDAPVHFSGEYEYDKGLDLINKTTLLEAAKIMSEAEVVIGLDNGLLHLAATTSVDIVFGYTISGPVHTQPRRRKGHGNLANVHPLEERLSCIFCQSKMRMIKRHDFKNCIYGDSACAELLNEPDGWYKALDLIFDAKNK